MTRSVAAQVWFLAVVGLIAVGNGLAFWVLRHRLAPRMRPRGVSWMVPVLGVCGVMTLLAGIGLLVAAVVIASG